MKERRTRGFRDKGHEMNPSKNNAQRQANNNISKLEKKNAKITTENSEKFHVIYFVICPLFTTVLYASA